MTTEKKTKKLPSERAAWSYLLIAGLLEIIWATGLKSTEIPSLVTLIAILVSFDLFIRALSKIPIGTGYAVFTGIGTLGTVFVEIFWFGISINIVKIALILLLATCIVGLKMTSEPVQKEG
jgi:paired small multidrug resistance pump